MSAFPAEDLSCLTSNIKLLTLNADGRGISTSVHVVGPAPEEIVPILVKLVALSLLPNNSSGAVGVSPPLLSSPRITLNLTCNISACFVLLAEALIPIDLAHRVASFPKNLRYFSVSVEENPPFAPDPVPDST